MFLLRLQWETSDCINAFVFYVSSLTDIYDEFFLKGLSWKWFLVEYRERNTVRAKSDRVGEGTGGMFPEEEDEKRRAWSSLWLIWFSVIRICYVVRACIKFFGDTGHFAEGSGVSGAMSHLRKPYDWQSDYSNIGEGEVVYWTKRTRRSTQPWNTP